MTSTTTHPLYGTTFANFCDYQDALREERTEVTRKWEDALCSDAELAEAEVVCAVLAAEKRAAAARSLLSPF
jgi:hypothetical protein